MKSYYEIMKIIMLAAACIVIFTLAVDFVLTYAIKRRKPSFKNEYYKLNLKYGFQKMNILKIVIGLTVIYLLVYPGMGIKVLAPIFIVFVYCVIVVKMMLEFFRSIKAEDK